MPVDGSYGRLSAHRQRFHELRRKKLERREKRLLRNSIKSIQSEDKEIIKDPVHPDTLEQLKIEIREKAKKHLRNEFLLIVLSIILGFIIVYFMVTNMK